MLITTVPNSVLIRQNYKRIPLMSSFFTAHAGDTIASKWDTDIRRPNVVVVLTIAIGDH